MASSLTQHFDDDLSCPVCLENFVGDNIPKDLDCPHVCCQICLNSIPTDIIGGLRCPQCQHITVIPPGGVSALRTNLRVRSLAEKLEDHRKANMSKMCTFHNDQEIFFFCRTCSSAVCQYCIINAHSEHKYEPIISVVKEQRQKLGRALQRVQAQIDKCEQNDRKITRNEEALVSKFQSAETKIDLRIQACLDEVNNQGRELKDKLHRLKAVTLETVQRHKQTNLECLQGKKKVLAEAQNTCDQSSDAEYMRLYDRWFGTIKTLIEDDSSSVAAVYPVESGYKLEIGPWNVNLGLNLMPEQVLADSDHDVPSTSSAPQEDLGGQGDASNKRPLVYGNQVSTSTKRCKLDDDDDDEEVLLVSDTEDNDDDTIFDLTDDPVVC